MGGGPTVRNCVIERGQASWGGGGIGAIDASPLIEACLFRENMTEFWGGGVAIMGTASGEIRDCRFERNTGGNGCGVYCGPLRFDGAGNNTAIRNCQFIGGRSPIGATAGGGVHVRSGEPLIVDCAFIGNESDGGGGVGIIAGGAHIERCLFLGNRGDGDGGGAVAALDFDATVPKFRVNLVSCLLAGNNGGMIAAGTIVNLSNCTVVHNIMPDTPFFLVWPAFWSHNAPYTLTNTIVWGNLERGFAEGEREFLAGSTMYEVHDSIIEDWMGLLSGDALAVDPGFIDTNGPDGNALTPDDNNYRLRLDSPAVDSGNQNAVPAGADADVEGRPRFLDGNGDSVAIVDIGAYERCYVDINGDGLTDLADATAMVEGVQGPFVMSTGGDLDQDGDTDLVDYAILQRFLPAGCN